MLGGLNIIGNPLNLFTNIRTDINGLAVKLVDALIKDTYEPGKGIADSTTSLMTHSIGGVLNTVEKMTGRVASGLAALTFDQEFEEIREKSRMRKPKHVLEGLEKGSIAGLHGFKEGVAGLLTKPIEQTKK
jgi:hypothetical protein